MAEHTGETSAHATLVGSQVDTVNLTGGNAEMAELVNHGNVAGAVIYYRTDGVSAAVAADENRVVLAGERVRLRLPPRSGTGATAQLSIVSAAAVTFSLIAVS